MLRILLCGFLLAAGHLHAQSEPLTVPVDGAATLHLSALFSNVEITTTAGTDVTVTHLLSVDGKTRPDLAKLEVSRSAGVLSVTETSPTQKQLEAEMKRTSTVINGHRTTGYDDRNIDVRMIVAVPRGLAVTVETVYGSVEVRDVASLRKVDATYGTVTVSYSSPAVPDLDLYSNYGSVDLTLPAAADARLELTTEFGELLTDFDLAINTGESERRDFYEHVVATIGSGASPNEAGQVQCRAPYGKVYLRRGQ